MTHRFLLSLALCLPPLAASAAEPAHAGGQHAPLAEIDPVIEAEMHRLESDYEQDVIAHHAAHRSARSLLVAAILTRRQPLRDLAAIPKANRADLDASDVDPRHSAARRLYERALEQGGNDPLALWTIANESHRDDMRGMAEAAAQQLTVVDADNAAAWLLLLHLGDRVLTNAEKDALLERAAESAAHRTYYAETVRLLAEAFRAVPRVEALVAIERRYLDVAGVTQSDRAAAFMRAFGIAMAISVPSATSAGNACRRPAAGGARHATCLQLAQLMAQHADSLAGRHIGLGLWERLTTDTPAHADVVSMRQTADWQLEAYGEVLQASLVAGGSEWSRSETVWSESGKDEVDVMHEVLQAAGVSLLPPEDFVSSRQFWRKAPSGQVETGSK